MGDSLGDLSPHAPGFRVVRAVEQLDGDADDVAKQLMEEFTSDELYHLIPGDQKSGYTEKSERAMAVVRRVAQGNDEFNPFDSE